MKTEITRTQLAWMLTALREHEDSLRDQIEDIEPDSQVYQIVRLQVANLDSLARKISAAIDAGVTNIRVI